MSASTQAWRDYRQMVLDRTADWSFVFEGLAGRRPAKGGWMQALCPFHEDKNPSFSFNSKTGAWCCHAGCGKGDGIGYRRRVSNGSFRDILFEFGDRVGVARPSPNGSRPPIEEGLVRQWAANLWADAERVRVLQGKRGLIEVTLKTYQIGWDPKRQRYTIPVRNHRGSLVNIRLYSPTKARKLIHYKEGDHGYGLPARLFGVDELVRRDSRKVVLCEGEWDRLLLQQTGFLAVTGTHGAGTFRPEWVGRFRAKDVVVIYDCDEAGRQAAEKVVVPMLRSSGAASVKNVLLPLRGDPDDKDITDYLHKGGHTAAELQALIDRTPAVEYLPVSSGLTSSTDSDPDGGAAPDAEVERYSVSGPPSPYREAGGGIVWDKPTLHGLVEAPLTNFTARIASQVARDDGQECRTAFELTAVLRGRTYHFALPSERFAGMGWPTEYMGAAALVYPGTTVKDHARAAIQILSGDPPRRCVFTHTGWREIDGRWCYLHAEGAVGPQGPVSGVEVELPAALTPLRLPAPGDADAQREATRASLALLQVAEPRIMWVVLGATYRSVLLPSDFSLHLALMRQNLTPRLAGVERCG